MVSCCHLSFWLNDRFRSVGKTYIDLISSDDLVFLRERILSWLSQLEWLSSIAGPHAEHSLPLGGPELRYAKVSVVSATI